MLYCLQVILIKVGFSIFVFNFFFLTDVFVTYVFCMYRRYNSRHKPTLEKVERLFVVVAFAIVALQLLIHIPVTVNRIKKKFKKNMFRYTGYHNYFNVTPESFPESFSEPFPETFPERWRQISLAWLVHRNQPSTSLMLCWSLYCPKYVTDPSWNMAERALCICNTTIFHWKMQRRPCALRSR